MAAEALRLFVPVAIRAVMSQLRPGLAAATRQKVVATVDLNPVIPERIRAGAPFDIALTNPPYARELIAEGSAFGPSHRPFARVRLAVARKAGGCGAPLTEGRDIATLLSCAESIGYTGEGTSGQRYLSALQGLGLDPGRGTQNRPMAAGVPLARVASGDLAFAVAPLATILATAGTEVAAIFPDALNAHIDMSVFLARDAGTGAVTALEYLTDPARDAVLERAGLVRFHFE